jgi:hypothetical protein
MLWNGECCFHTPPGEAEGIICRVCGTECIVEHNIMGPTCFAAAMSGSKCLHDRATCPYSDMAWHEEAHELINELRDTHSKRLRSLIEEDLIELLEANGKSWLLERPAK